MANNISNSFINIYHDSIILRAQQKGSHLRKAVRLETFEGEYFDVSLLTKSEASEVSEGSALSTTDQTTVVRRLNTKWYKHNSKFNKFEKVKLIADPRAPFQESGAAAINRKIDDVVIAAFDADAITGKIGDGTASFDSTMTVTATGSNSFGVTEMIAAMTKLRENDVYGDEMYMVISEKTAQELLNDTTYTSSDFNILRPLMAGELVPFMGFNIFTSNRLLTDGNGFRKCFAWAKSGMCLGISKDIKTELNKLTHLDDQPWEVRTDIIVGATRLEEEKVVKILVQE